MWQLSADVQRHAISPMSPLKKVSSVSRRAKGGEGQDLIAAKVMRPFGELQRSRKVGYGEAMVDWRGMRGAAGRGCRKPKQPKGGSATGGDLGRRIRPRTLGRHTSGAHDAQLRAPQAVRGTIGWTVASKNTSRLDAWPRHTTTWRRARLLTQGISRVT